MLHVAIAAEPGGCIIPAGPNERRYCAFDLATDKQQDEAYFAALYEQMENGGYAAMLFDLLQRDISKFHPRQIVRTGALVEQQAENLTPFESWFVELLETGMLPGATSMAPDIAPTNDYEIEVIEGLYTRRLKKPGLLSNARESSPRLKNETEHALGRFLREHKCTSREHVGTSIGRGKGWKFPPLIEARAAWEKKFPRWPWREKLEEWNA